MSHLLTNSDHDHGYKYNHMVGTGGIGSGMVFQLEGNHTLGRNESRKGKQLANSDYCKLHIITHYVAVLLGAKENKFKIYPIGKVGDDHRGDKLLNELKQVGISCTYVDIETDYNTLFSICFQYPDSTGGNITTSNSASSQVKAKDVSSFFKNFEEQGDREIILAVPEVPVTTRINLLEKGRERGSFNIASVLSSEVKLFEELEGYLKTDLLAINIDEAGAIINNGLQENKIEGIIRSCIKKLRKINSDLIIFITVGPEGCYSYYKEKISFNPALKTEAVGTGGAGDSFLAGLITGLNCGLPLVKKEDDDFFSQTPLDSAAELGILVASLGITSPDTIYWKLNSELLLEYAQKRKIDFSPRFQQLWGKLC